MGEMFSIDAEGRLRWLDEDEAETCVDARYLVRLPDGDWPEQAKGLQGALSQLDDQWASWHDEEEIRQRMTATLVAVTALRVKTWRKVVVLGDAGTERCGWEGHSLPVPVDSGCDRAVAYEESPVRESPVGAIGTLSIAWIGSDGNVLLSRQTTRWQHLARLYCQEEVLANRELTRRISLALTRGCLVRQPED